jgi:hypothetical protein
MLLSMMVVARRLPVVCGDLVRVDCSCLLCSQICHHRRQLSGFRFISFRVSAAMSSYFDTTRERILSGRMYSLAPLFWPHRPADKNVSHDGQKDFQHSRNSHNPALIHPSIHPPTPLCSEVLENSKQHNNSKQQQSSGTNNQPTKNNKVAATTIARVPNEFTAIPCCCSKTGGVHKN